MKLLCELSLFEDAVSLALDVDLGLAKAVANTPEDDDSLRRKLWLSIAKHVVQGGGGAAAAAGGAAAGAGGAAGAEDGPEQAERIKMAVEFLKEAGKAGRESVPLRHCSLTCRGSTLLLTSAAVGVFGNAPSYLRMTAVTIHMLWKGSELPWHTCSRLLCQGTEDGNRLRDQPLTHVCLHAALTPYSLHTLLYVGGLLKIEDILPFFPDFVTIDNFKGAITDSLTRYNRQIEELKAEMDEATEIAGGLWGFW